MTGIGKKRFLLSFSLNILGILLLIILINFFCYFFIGIFSIYVTPLYFIAIILLYEGYSRFSKSYYIEKINDTEWNSLLTKKLIHYTNNITDDEYLHFKQSGEIKLLGNSSSASNYVMKLKDKNKSYVWFHTEDPVNKNEPELKSFIFSHLTESSPRKYKVIIEPNELDRDRIFIRPDNRNIVYEGDIKVKARIETDFSWYNEHFYLKHIVWPSIISCLLIKIYHSSFHQLLGVFIDKIKKIKLKSTTMAN